MDGYNRLNTASTTLTPQTITDHPRSSSGPSSSYPDSSSTSNLIPSFVTCAILNPSISTRFQRVDSSIIYLGLTFLVKLWNGWDTLSLAIHWLDGHSLPLRVPIWYQGGLVIISGIWKSLRIIPRIDMLWFLLLYKVGLLCDRGLLIIHWYFKKSFKICAFLLFLLLTSSYMPSSLEKRKGTLTKKCEKELGIIK